MSGATRRTGTAIQGLPLTPSEKGLLLRALRVMRTDHLRGQRASTRRLEAWTTDAEAANPGYRDFLAESIAKHTRAVTEISALLTRVDHAPTVE